MPCLELPRRSVAGSTARSRSVKMFNSPEMRTLLRCYPNQALVHIWDGEGRGKDGRITSDHERYDVNTYCRDARGHPLRSPEILFYFPISEEKGPVYVLHSPLTVSFCLSRSGMTCLPAPPGRYASLLGRHRPPARRSLRITRIELSDSLISRLSR